MSRGESSGPFRVGDRVQLTGPKGRLHTITLEPGKVFHSHKGPIAHDDLIGLADGSAPHDSGPAKAAAYAVTPLATSADWDLSSATCSDGSAPSAVALGSSR